MGSSFIKKTSMIGLLIALLNIPLGFISDTIEERSMRNGKAHMQIASTWGRAQGITGPVLTIPYYDSQGTLQHACFLSDTLDITAKISPEKRYRGIFEVIVYRAEISMSGTFGRPDFSAWDIESYQILWDKATLTIGLNELKGIQLISAFQWNGNPAPLRPGEKTAPGIYGLAARLFPDREPDTKSDSASSGFEDANRFNIVFNLHGSSEIRFAPTSDTTTVAVTSPWPHPSFQGSYLPVKRTITPEGFKAKWQVSGFGRDYPGQWNSEQKDAQKAANRFTNGMFGVKLIQPVNFYTLSERSVKYALLIITLTFLCFFMFEILNRLKIHPMQYLLVGFSLSLFYLLLISFSEHIGFLPAYVLSAAACVVLITWYARSFLGSSRSSLITGGVLSGFFALFYIILQHEGYSLVMGTSSLFFILALVMGLTRKLDWYSVFKAAPGLKIPAFRSKRRPPTCNPMAEENEK
ncbi:cell envelope integrity protein CreD [uncultured Desulfobacter sp.]|uniref:cell envelope integrity protein CreD n=1 Tax=uncultured Desulfobacter sp. TaxID=240139 RepID=UPI002AA83193|nr:cell envelope integrity protein CreD [uncultured Desulfobacter sp.]